METGKTNIDSACCNIRIGFEDTSIESPMDLPVIPMSFEEFDLMERPFGWKVEYWDGHAHLTPRSMGVTTKINLASRHFSHSHQLVPVTPDYRKQMIAGHLETFADSVEFCGWPRESIAESAVKDIDNYFAGNRGEPLTSSVLALVPGSQELAGLTLLIQRPEQAGAYMRLLYVRPAFQGQGIATAMLYRAIDSLLKAGFPTLSSTYHVCNEQSRQWYHRHGFEDEYDWYYAKMKVSWYQSEIWRQGKLGQVAGLADLERERDRWAAMIPEDLSEF
jgi:GNAT superfamily N-acetyltransferase